MARLSDSIESFIKDLLDTDSYIDLQRNELAQHFNCAPSQINYVLATRFTVDHGYIIESHRGGGGYVRIVHVAPSDDEDLLLSVLRRVGSEISEAEAFNLIINMYENKRITQNEALLIKAAVKDGALIVPAVIRDSVRASVFKSIIKQVFVNNGLRGDNR